MPVCWLENKDDLPITQYRGTYLLSMAARVWQVQGRPGVSFEVFGEREPAKEGG